MKQQINVELLDHHGSDAAVANAARVSFADLDNWNEIPEGYSEERQEKLIGYLASHRHMTPFRHNSISIRCKAPIFIARQLGKHQAGLSWNEVSRRYVDDNFEFFIPLDWRSRPVGGIKQGSGDAPVVDIFDTYKGETRRVCDMYADHVDRSLQLYDDMDAGNIAPEMARMVLPQSMVTEWVWTGNLLAFSHVYNERIAEGAQQEARDFAKSLDETIAPLFPVAWKALTSKE